MAIFLQNVVLENTGEFIVLCHHENSRQEQYETIRLIKSMNIYVQGLIVQPGNSNETDERKRTDKYKPQNKSNVSLNFNSWLDRL